MGFGGGMETLTFTFLLRKTGQVSGIMAAATTGVASAGTFSIRWYGFL